ncbi:hypothetical protein [Qingshengfaniella alkalisoli]|uniref:Uncharacterized protein n=1 Tax=Qingshengfaniella alkalisoli TaxID=2599296 RepID=A0A5B8J815_9RHOB|nr:hypothetical protein [Qingshengfaniella alkalisoli]QDY70390.1 hypothetical protein FPZ52_11725 [Qingshengfaniella alkalisoli]
MTTTTGPISRDGLDEMRAMLQALEPKPKTSFTNREAVKEMAQDILRARDELGYSIEDIAMMLGKHHVAIKPATLRGYLRDLEAAKGKVSRAGKRAPRSARPAARASDYGVAGHQSIATAETSSVVQTRAAQEHPGG